MVGWKAAAVLSVAILALLVVDGVRWVYSVFSLAYLLFLLLVLLDVRHTAGSPQYHKVSHIILRSICLCFVGSFLYYTKY